MMKNNKSIAQLFVAATVALLMVSFGTLNNTKAQASVPESSYSTKVLRKNGITKRTLPKKYRGTWYSYEAAYRESPSSMDKLKITKHSVDGKKVRVANKLVKIHGKYRLAAYYDQMLTYFNVTGKGKQRKLTFSFVQPITNKHGQINHSKITKLITMDQPFYLSKKQAKAHPFNE